MAEKDKNFEDNLMIFVYTPCKNKQEAKKIAKTLLKKKMVACVNMFPIYSMYWWKGKIEESEEVVLISKTLRKNWQAVFDEIKNLHSYDTPFIGSIKINKINGPFYQHLKKSVSKYYGKKSPHARPNIKKRKIKKKK